MRGIRQVPGDTLIQHNAQSVYICGRRCRTAFDLFWSHESRRADDLPGNTFGLPKVVSQTEVSDYRAIPLADFPRYDHHIARFEILVNHACPVSCIQPFGHLPGEI